ncbi:MAG: PmoA family protein [Cyclobacteriaceae bacterium]|nr:PmoA family protein [Cyclobacteriaceae bacterium]
MYKIFLTLAILCFFNFLPVIGQTELAQITVNAGPYDRNDIVVQASLDGLNLDIANSTLVLVEVIKGKETITKAALVIDDGHKLIWRITGKTPAGTVKKYSLRSQNSRDAEAANPVSIDRLGNNLLVRYGDKNILQYNFDEAPVPKGASPLFRRGGFIHPLWTPKGEVLTRIQPPDHYHHMGLWNPWTHTEYNGKIIDFWNLIKGEGTVKPVSVTSITENPYYAGFKVLHDHVDLNGVTADGFLVILKEKWDVKVWDAGPDFRVIDFVSTFNNVTDSVFTIKEYRYQGFGLRATEKWNDGTAKIITSDGKDKSTGNGTRARWCDINGESVAGTSGVVFMTNPSNYNFPEPIRIWPTGTNGKVEDVFFNFNPAMDRDWVIKPHQNYQLRYRMLLYDGSVSVEQVERLWRDYAYPPAVSVVPVQK